jgi:tetratricopeptide (TPR) repeat protein
MDSYVEEARDLFRQKQVAQALAVLEKAKKADPKSPYPYAARAELLARGFHYRQAYEELCAARRIAPRDHRLLMTLLAYTPPHVPAKDMEQVAREAVALQPSDSQAYYYLGQAIANSNDPARYGEAMKAFETAVRLAPTEPRIQVEMGKLHSVMGDHLRSVALLENAWQLMKMQQGSGPEPVPSDLDKRTSVAFWLAQEYRRAGKITESKRMGAEAARLSALLQEVTTLRDRAAANPPDLAAQARLQALLGPREDAPGGVMRPRSDAGRP